MVLGVEMFSLPSDYRSWAMAQYDIEITSVVVFQNTIVVTWKKIEG